MTKKKFKFNITDFIIIVVLIAALAVLAYVFVLSDDTKIEGEPHTVRYVVEVTNINEIFSDAVKEGDTVTLAEDRDAVLGVVCAPPEVKNTLNALYDEESGKEVYPGREGLVNFYITFEAETYKQDWGYAIGKEEQILLVNDTIELLVGEFYCTAGVIELEVID